MTILNILKEKLASESIQSKVIQEYTGIYYVKASDLTTQEVFFILTEMEIEIMNEKENVKLPIEDLDLVVKKLKDFLQKLQ
jgi:hypothetical protein